MESPAVSGVLSPPEPDRHAAVVHQLLGGQRRARSRVPGETKMVDGIQVLDVGLVGGYYRPNRFTVQAGVPVKVVFTGWAQDVSASRSSRSSVSRAT